MSTFLPAWHLNAACSNNPELDWFSETPAGIAAAKAVCAGCAVLQDCLTDALARQDPWGVQAGLTATERMTPLLLAEVGPPPHVVSRGCYVTNHCQDAGCRAANAAYAADLRSRQSPATDASKVETAEQLALDWSAA